MNPPHDTVHAGEPPLARRFDSLPGWLCVLFVAVVVAVSFARLFYGVDFVDESTYVAVPYRFCLGDTPFVDEHTPIQTSALLSLPFVELFYAVRGDSEGLVLFMRLVYFALFCGVATVVALGLKPLVGKRGASIVASACIAFCPLGVPNLSYNTWSIACFTIGIFVGLQHLLWQRRIAWLFAAGLAHGFAAVALASYAAPNLVYAAAILCLLGRETRWRGFALYAAGGIAAFALLFPWLRRFDQQTLDNAYFHVHTAEGWMSRARQFAYQVWVFVPVKLEIALVLGVAWLGLRFRRAWLAVIALALLPLFPLLLKRSTHALWYATVLALCGTVLLAFAWRAPFAKRLLLGVWLPSLCAGAVVSFTSLNGLFVSGCGLFPIVLAGMAVSIVLVRESVSSSTPIFLRKLDLAFPMLAVAAWLGYQRQPFGDDAVRALDTRIESGPFRGLRTSRQKEQFLSAISADLCAAEHDHSSVLFLVHFPAGYLITHMRPATECIWTYPCTGGPWDLCYAEMRRDIDEHAGPELLVVRMHAFPTRHDNLWESFPNELDDVLTERFRPIVDRDAYTLFEAK